MTPRTKEAAPAGAAPVEAAVVESGRRVPQVHVTVVGRDGRVSPVGELLHLPPSQIATSTNVRRDLALDEDFVASVRQHGVLLPLTATRDLFGDPIVVDGHRRLAAALEAGLETVPVYVRPQALDEAAVRIAEQIVANDQRTGLTSGDRLEAIGQLALFGLSDEQISVQTRVPVETVAAGRRLVSDERVTALREGAQADSLAGDVEVLAVVAEALELGVDQPMVEHHLSRPSRERSLVLSTLRGHVMSRRAVRDAIEAAAQRGEKLLSVEEWLERTGTEQWEWNTPGRDVGPAHQEVCVAPCRVVSGLAYSAAVSVSSCCLEPATCPGMQAEAAADEAAVGYLRARREEAAAREAERHAAAVESSRLRAAHLRDWLVRVATWMCTDLVVRLVVTLQAQGVALSWSDQDLGEVLRDWLGVTPAQAASRFYSAKAATALVLASLESMCSEELATYVRMGVVPWRRRPLEQAAAYLVALRAHADYQLSELEEELLSALAGEDVAAGHATDDIDVDVAGDDAGAGEGGEQA